MISDNNIVLKNYTYNCIQYHIYYGWEQSKLWNIGDSHWRKKNEFLDAFSGTGKLKVVTELFRLSTFEPPQSSNPWNPQILGTL